MCERSFKFSLPRLRNHKLGFRNRLRPESAREAETSRWFRNLRDEWIHRPAEACHSSFVPSFRSLKSHVRGRFVTEVTQFPLIRPPVGHMTGLRLPGRRSVQLQAHRRPPRSPIRRSGRVLVRSGLLKPLRRSERRIKGNLNGFFIPELIRFVLDTH